MLLDSSATDDALIQSLEAGIRQLKIRLRERSDLQQERDDLGDECDQLQDNNTRLRAEIDDSKAQLQHAEERIRELERANDDERRQHVEILGRRTTELADERRGSEALVLECEQLEEALSDARRQAEDAATTNRLLVTQSRDLERRLNIYRHREENSFANAIPIHDRAPWLAQALKSKYVEPQTDYRMTTSTGHCGPNRSRYPEFNPPLSSGCFIDWNGEVAWIKVWLVTQSYPRRRITYG